MLKNYKSINKVYNEMKIIIIFCAMSMFIFSINSCDSDETKTALVTNDSIVTKTDNIVKNENSKDSLYRISVSLFVVEFYKSLELSQKQNDDNYNNGGDNFDKNKFLSLINKESKFSKKRVDNLTGDYNAMYNIELVKIDSINIYSDIVSVYTIVDYYINEVGTFQNVEHLEINNIRGVFSLNKWLDVKVNKMTVQEIEGFENYNDKDFYKSIGSLNKGY
jgi:hypothetical protein